MTNLSRKRELCHLRFEWLRLALTSDSPAVKAAIEKNSDFYKSLGDVTSVDFDDWWEQHHGSCEEMIRVNISLWVPLNRGIHLNWHFDPPSNELGDRVEVLDSKGFRGNLLSDFEVTKGKQPKLRALRERLFFYRDIYKKYPGMRRRALLDLLDAKYHAKDIPDALKLDGSKGETRAMRNLRRYVGDAERLMLNAAERSFPGP